MVDGPKLPNRRIPGRPDIVSPPTNKVDKKFYHDETFMLGLYIGIFSTICLILFCLIIIGLIGAIVSSFK